eukprot:4380442-Karenia_brevis.AAC.1
MPDCSNVVLFVHALVKLIYTTKIQVYNNESTFITVPDIKKLSQKGAPRVVEAHEIMTKLRSMTSEFNGSTRDKVIELIDQADLDL